MDPPCMQDCLLSDGQVLSPLGPDLVSALSLLHCSGIGPPDQGLVTATSSLASDGTGRKRAGTLVSDVSVEGSSA